LAGRGYVERPTMSEFSDIKIEKHKHRKEEREEKEHKVKRSDLETGGKADPKRIRNERSRKESRKLAPKPMSGMATTA